MKAKYHFINVILFESLIISKYSFEDGIITMNVVKVYDKIIDKL